MMDKGRALLTGFDSSVFLDAGEPIISVVGPVARRAPEMIQGLWQGSEVDVWQFGILCFELATGDPAFDGASGE